MPNQDVDRGRLGDYNGDGKADILWRNGSTGANVDLAFGQFGHAAGRADVGDRPGASPAPAITTATARADILWRNSPPARTRSGSRRNFNTTAPSGTVTDLTWFIAG